VIEEVAKPLYKHKGLINYKIMTHWNEIVGVRFAKICIPVGVYFPDEKHVNGTLAIEVENPGFGLEIQANQMIVVERMANYFGYRAISKIKINIATKRKSKLESANVPKIVTQKQISNQEVKKALSDVKDREIREILENIIKYKNES
jgi:hypothetical protein